MTLRAFLASQLRKRPSPAPDPATISGGSKVMSVCASAFHERPALTPPKLTGQLVEVFAPFPAACAEQLQTVRSRDVSGSSRVSKRVISSTRSRCEFRP